MRSQLPDALWGSLARRWRTEWVLFTTVLVLATAALSLSSPWTGLQRLDYALYDWHLDSMPSQPISSEIIIIAVDDDSIARLGRWPWPRRIHAQLLSHLHQAKAVALDILFTEAQQPDDALLAHALAEHGRTVLPTAMTPNGLLQPIAPLRRAAAETGVVNIWPDDDGTVRSLRFLPTDHRGVPQDHLLLSLLDVGGDQSYADTLRQQGDTPRLIPWVGAPGSFHFLSYADVLSGRIPNAMFADKYVLVGVWGTGLRDMFSTPRSSAVFMSGVEIMANALENALGGLWIHRPKHWISALLASLPVLLMCLMLRRYSPRQAFFGMLLLVALLFFLHWLLLTWFLLWVPVFAALIGVVLCVPVWNWRTLEMSLTTVDHELHALSTVLPNRKQPVKHQSYFYRSLAARIITLHGAMDTLRKSQQQRDATLHFLSHDIRAPQSAILALTQLQRQMETALPQAALLRHIEQHATRTLALADSFINLARAESAQIQPHTLYLPDLLLDAMDAAWAQASHKSMTLQHGELPPSAFISGDQDLLTRALHNVIDNAIKYSPAHTRIDCALYDVPPHWVVEIRDQGQGIAAERIPDLFIPFSRAHAPAPQDDPGGFGLGLAFVHATITRHGGSISVESYPEQGTVFRLSLPAVAAPPP